MRRSTRNGWAGRFVVLGMAAVLLADDPSAQAQTGRLAIAPFYDVQRIDSPDPTISGRFGGMIHNAGDITGDGVDDILAPENTGQGLVRVISGATGAHFYTVEYPDSPEGRNAEFGTMVTRVADLGSCPGGEPGELCPNGTVGARDEVPEFAVGAYRVNIGEAVDVGRVYVYDGATGALIKRLQMPPEDIASEAEISPSLRPFSFGRGVISPYSNYPTDAPQAVKIGDMNGDGFPDIVVGNSSFYERGPETNPACDPGPCEGAGRVYFFAGSDIAGSDPAAPLDEPFKVVRNPTPLTNSAFYQGFGHTFVIPGDVGGCRVDPGPGQWCPAAEASANPNALANVIVSHIRAKHGDFIDAGRGWLLDGATGAILQRYDHPSPQVGDLFAYPLQHTGGGFGTMAGSAHPDVILPSIFHNLEYANQGRAWVFNGNHRTSAGGIVLSVLDDPDPMQEGNFGGPVATIGDVAGDLNNEVLIGNRSNRPDRVSAAHIFSPSTGEVVYRIEDPDQQPGSAFGTGVASLGDVNGDGYIDFAVGAWNFDDGELVQRGRLYIFRSSQQVPVEPGPEPSPDPQVDDEGVVRLSGSDRIATAIAVSRHRFADGAAPAAVVARADVFADALAGGPLTVRVGGPLLLTSGDELPAVVGDELQRVVQPEGVVYVLGGHAAVSEAAEDKIRALGFSTRRMYGPTRVETAIAIVRALGNPETLLVTTGFNFPDALAAVPAAAQARGAVLLTTPERPHPSLDAYLEERVDAQVFAVGGPAVRAYPAATPVFGPTRAHTAVAVAERFFPAVQRLGIARQDDFPDALTGGAHIAGVGGPMLLTAVSSLPETTAAYVCANRTSIAAAYVYGGSAAVSQHVVDQLGQRLDGVGC